ncbi:MAG TPA: tRNA pseudouridine(38-40) synthase TruA [Paenalcaligenes hominis]|uniref:tRNA pseudouridine synthase A n=1 Tax=Paenalcaligenes hominis TaxID=643674 RepID=A0A9D2VHG2_9BURK|nr:tRNA pseudouridine(38-40) synthase TruA [Paenalcaligenes hominis]
MQRMALGLCYDGSAWQGWQTQPSGRTLQDQLEKVLQQFLAHPVSTVCAGRTDAGVHALNQVVHLETPAQRTPESWIRGLNALLPSSMSVQWAHAVPEHFHARFSAQRRRYVYVLRNERVRSPLVHQRVGWVFQPLNYAAMQDAAQRLLGTHDFSAFRSAECQAASPVRTLMQLTIHHHAPWFVFEFEANAFLHHMIRNLMGALVYIGMGRQPSTWVDELLRDKDRKRAAPTFSAEGLYLAGVDYAPEFGLPTSSSLALSSSLLGINWNGF